MTCPSLNDSLISCRAYLYVSKIPKDEMKDGGRSVATKSIGNSDTGGGKKIFDTLTVGKSVGNKSSGNVIDGKYFNLMVT